jgi:ADP-ribosyl-[dinitrogen reductase] hydrolase
MTNRLNNIEGCFLGLAVGDALGVPIEFRDRETLLKFPVKTMTGNGTWKQPAGTWSDDSSLTFCTAESLINGYALNDIGTKFVRWMKEGYWGAHHKVFDIGGTTRHSLQRIFEGENPLYSGDFEEESNGNGSLMRIAPASIFFHRKENEELLIAIREVSSITHAHFRAVFSCFLYSKFIQAILFGMEKTVAFERAMSDATEFVSKKEFYEPEIKLFNRLLEQTLIEQDGSTIHSSGYVLHTLEASIWCFLNTESYSEAVLKAINLGGDTDTTGCVTGALAGLYYGKDSIPSEWINTIARLDDIVHLSEEFSGSLRKIIL